MTFDTIILSVTALTMLCAVLVFLIEKSHWFFRIADRFLPYWFLNCAYALAVIGGPMWFLALLLTALYGLYCLISPIL